MSGETGGTALFGRVIEEQKNYYIVSTARGDVRCKIKGALLKGDRRVRVCAGDAVEIRLINADSAEGVISAMEKRTSYLPRPALANISQVIFINCFKHPRLDLETVDRFLFTSAAYDIDAVIVFNKMDLLDDNEIGELESIENYYRGIGYKTLRTSVPNDQGVAELFDICRGKTSAFTGLSGVGKSSLLSLIFPNVEFRTNDVSGAHGRGTHTTTHIKLLAADADTFIADTPGFAFVNVPTVPADAVGAHFPEIEKVTGMCKFNNCVHDAEPGCYVNELVDKGEIMPWRHAHYLKIHNEMTERRKAYHD